MNAPSSDLPAPLADLDRPWHALPADEALRVLDARREGLSAEEVAARRGRFGPNALPKRRRATLLMVYLKQFRNPLIYLLLAAAAVAVGLGDLANALFIFLVLQINAVIGTMQEWKAQSGAAALRAQVRATSMVRRAGGAQRIGSVEIVPGDIVVLDAGARIPADIRLLESADLRADESLLTGESLPVDKCAAAELPEDAALGDRATLLHAGSTVLSGRAVGVAARTGPATEIGRIAKALERQPPAPPLLLRLERFTRAIGLVTMAAVAVLMGVQFVLGAPLREVFFVAVALAVSAIPEGLPVAVTVALSVATARMARRHVIVRLLPAVEGLGACTVIASDKTGTLTLNRLTLARLWLPGQGEIAVGGDGLAPEGGFSRDGRPLDAAAEAALRRLALSAALANEASYRPGGPEAGGEPVAVGDTVDIAFLVLAAKLGIAQEQARRCHPQQEQIPFSAERRYAATVNRHEGGDRVHVKGAAEAVLPMCAGIDRAAMLAEAERMAADGYRVLAVATGPADQEGRSEDGPENALRGLAFLGFAGLIDPLRPEAPEAVARCRRAGVAVRMVTGDHPATALAIARRLGFAERPDQVVTGRDLAALDERPAEQAALVERAAVFARVEPTQKTLIVQSLQQAGHVVAVTGDGVNDAPALHAADIGVAMGRAGTDVARDAADLILTDDNFASIVAGIEEGRIAYANVRKVIYLLISTGAAEVGLFFLALLLGLPLPLFAAQLLWLNLVTNGGQDVALAFEKGEPGLLDRRPRPPEEPIFDRRMIEETVISGLWMGVVSTLFFAWALEQGWGEFEARNALLLLMVAFQNAHVFNCRSETRSAFRVPLRNNRLLILAVVAAQGVHIAAMFVPGLNDVLAIRPLSPDHWLIVLPLALTVVPVMELYKWLRR